MNTSQAPAVYVRIGLMMFCVFYVFFYVFFDQKLTFESKSVLIQVNFDFKQKTTLCEDSVDENV